MTITFLGAAHEVTGSMTLLEVVGPQGRRVLTQPADDTTVMMDISNLPTGLFTVKAHTVCGTSARRLMVI